MDRGESAAALSEFLNRVQWRAVASTIVQVACGLFVGYWAGIGPAWFSLWWTPASAIAVACLALLAVFGRWLRPFFVTAAIFGGVTIAYSVALVVVLGTF